MSDHMQEQVDNEERVWWHGETRIEGVSALTDFVYGLLAEAGSVPPRGASGPSGPQEPPEAHEEPSEAPGQPRAAEAPQGPSTPSEGPLQAEAPEVTERPRVGIFAVETVEEMRARIARKWGLPVDPLNP